jgi:D-glycero-D-manno-heptose 1,7-bisphosphate phosphatase
VKLVLLDRDGTLIVHKPYLSDPDEVELLPGTVEGLRLLKEAGFLLAVVSNQSGVGRGYFGAEQVEAVNARLSELLRAEGISLDGVYWCPHRPDEGCACRKPKTGMLLQACADLGVDVADCTVVGDSDCDVALAHVLGLPAYRLVSPSNLGEAEATLRANADLSSLKDLLPLLGRPLTAYDAPAC